MLRTAILAALMLGACDSQGSKDSNIQTVDVPVVKFPDQPRASCPGSKARLYAECTDQRTILEAAQEAAKSEDKLVLVIFGAEWCVWCHVFDRHLTGEVFSAVEFHDQEGALQKLPQDRRDEREAASELGTYIAQNYVLAHIEADNPFGFQPEGGTGFDVLVLTKTNDLIADWIPYAFVMDGEGTFLGSFNTREAESREEEAGFFGYDRKALFAEAWRLRQPLQ